MNCSYDDLWKVIREVENEEVLAIQLPGFENDSSYIKKLRKDYQNGNDHFAKEIAKRWVERHPEKATWINLINTLRLKCIEENTLAHDLEEKHVRQRGSVSSTGSSFTSSDPAISGNTNHLEESMDVAPSPLSLDTTDNVDERSGVIRSDSLATTSDCSSPPTSPMSLSSASSPSSSLTGFNIRTRRDERVNSLHLMSLVIVKRHFNKFIDKIKEGFATITVDIEALKNELRPYCSVITDLNDMDSIITWFINEGIWDHWSCTHLCLIVNDYGNEAMKKAEKEYLLRKGEFLIATTLKDYVLANTNALSRSKTGQRPSTKRKRRTSEYRNNLAYKLDVEISTQTLDYIEKLWSRAESLMLPKIGIVLDNIYAGCVEILWIIINPEIIPDVRKKALLPEAKEFYRENKIIRVMLNGECLYLTKDRTASISSDVFNLPASDSIEEEPEEDSSELAEKEVLTTQGDLETIPQVTDEVDEVKSKEKTGKKTITEEPVELKPQAKEERNTVSEMLLAECSKKEADIEVVRGYLEQTDCDVRIREDDEFKWTPLMWACENNHFEIGRLLLTCRPPPQVDIQDKKEWSPLILASRAGDLEIVQGIVELGAEIDKPTNKKWTPLMWAAHLGHVEVARFLLEKGAFVDYPDENGWTPLMQASQEGRVGVVNLLLEHGAKINHQTETLWCALMAAAKNKRCEVVEALLKEGAEVDIERKDGTTTLQVASFFEGNSDILKILIKHGADVDHLSKDGMTALLLAINKGHLELVVDLLNGGADINLQHPETRWTPIFFAAKSGNMDIFKELLHRGAKTEIEERNVIDVASLFEHKEILSILKTIVPEIKTQEGHQKEPEEGTPSTTIETEVSTLIDPLPAVGANDPIPTAQNESKMATEKTTKKYEEKSITKKSVDIKREAKILALLFQHISNRMANERSNLNQSKGLPSFENFTHQELSPEVTNTLNITTPSPWRAVAVSEDPDEDLYNI